MTWKGAVLVVAVVAATSTLSWCHSQDRASWEAELRETLHKGDSLRSVAANAVEAAAAAELAAEASEARADSMGRLTRERVVVVREVEVPAEAVPYVAPRDSIIDDLLIETEDLRETIRHQEEVISNLRSALSDVTAAEAALRMTLENRPGPEPWWKPTITAGAFMGVCTDARPCSGAGFTIGWKVPWG